MPKGKFWNDSDKEWLIDNYEKEGCAYCAFMLGRSVESVYKIAFKMHLKRYGEGHGVKEYIYNGYLVISLAGERYFEHRHVMEIKLGRKLNPNELVHHKDENKLNNEPDNLELTNRSKHMSTHNETRKRNADGTFAPADDIV